jgi:hypothetical protein
MKKLPHALRPQTSPRPSSRFGRRPLTGGFVGGAEGLEPLTPSLRTRGMAVAQTYLSTDLCDRRQEAQWKTLALLYFPAVLLDDADSTAPTWEVGETRHAPITAPPHGYCPSHSDVDELDVLATPLRPRLGRSFVVGA